MPFIGPILSALATFIGGSSVASFVATKVILFALFVVVLPIVLWNLMTEWAQHILEFALSFIPDQSSTLYQMTGLAGWFAVEMNLPQAISVIVSGLITRFMLSAIMRL